MDDGGTTRHHGQWYYPFYGGTVAWTFDEEAKNPNLRPVYEVVLPLKSFVSGNKTLTGKPYGSFTMAKQ